MNQITERAYAKINLALDVLRRRPDGYHDVRMVMQTVHLYDKLTLSKSREPGISLKTNLPFLPGNENNLVYRAIDLFCKTYGIDCGIRATLEKRIPIAAGMAGGSSDAAAAFRAMNKLFHINASLEDLQALGVKLGADIPYCIIGGTALAEGIGEKLTALPAAPACSCLIVKPNFHLSTKLVYENLTLDDPSAHPDIDAMLDAVHTNSYKQMTSSIGNILETVSIRLYPEIAEIKQEMLALGADCSLMSGSGPSVFGLFEHRQVAERAYRKFRLGPYGKQTFLSYLR